MDVTDLNHVALNVADLELSAEFYGQTLGLPPLPRPDFSFSGAWFALGERSQLHLIVGSGETAGEGSRGSHFALEVADIGSVAARLEEKNVSHDVLVRPDGAQQIFLQDPDGHWVEFTALP